MSLLILRFNRRFIPAAPAAERIDLPWVVVAGPVRIVELEGGAVTQVR